MISQVVCYCIVSRERRLKEQLGYQFVPGDLELTPYNMIVIIAISFVGSVLAAFTAIGPGSIFVPVLTMIGVEARVAGATGMYVTCYMTLSSTIQLLIMGKIPLAYMTYVLVFTMVGTIPGLFFQNFIVERTGRVSYGVFILFSTLFVCGVSTLGINIPQMVSDPHEAFSFTNYCGSK